MLSVFGWWYVLGVLYDHFFWKHYQALLSLFTRRAAPGADGRAVSSGHALDGLLQLLSRHARHRSAGYVTHLLLLRGMCAFYHDLCGLRRRKHTIELFATCSSLLLWVSCVDIHRGRTTHLLALICRTAHIDRAAEGPRGPQAEHTQRAFRAQLRGTTTLLRQHQRTRYTLVCVYLSSDLALQRCRGVQLRSCVLFLCCDTTVGEGCSARVLYALL
jgi:hypothetical protein